MVLALKARRVWRGRFSGPGSECRAGDETLRKFAIKRRKTGRG